MSWSLFRASMGVRLLMSMVRISSRIWVSTGSSSWKMDNWQPERPVATSPRSLVKAASLRLLASSCLRTSFARLTMLGGMPASLATWIPKLCSLPPLTSWRTNTTFPLISLTLTLQFTMRLKDFSISLSSWQWVALGVNVLKSPSQMIKAPKKVKPVGLVC